MTDQQITVHDHWAADLAARKQIQAVFAEYGFVGGGNILRALDKVESGVSRLSESKATSLEEYLRWTHEALRGEPVAVICTSVSYLRGQTVIEDRLVFHTPVGNAEFDSLERFMICVGVGYTRANRIADLRNSDGEEQTIEPLAMMVARRRRDGEEYLLVTSIYKTEMDKALEDY